MHSAYLDLVSSVERLHRQFLEVVKLELDTNAVHDINNVQAMILYNIGDIEMTVGELTLRGCYLGSNVSYNVKKMLENGYIVQERSPHDRRSSRVRLSEKGLALHQKLKRMLERQMASVAQGVVQGEDMIAGVRTLRKLERFWMHMAQFASRVSGSPGGAWTAGVLEQGNAQPKPTPASVS
jgi:DNA-binding MarR family transcriptional regulator